MSTKPTEQSVLGRNTKPRTPGDPDPDSADSGRNAGNAPNRTAPTVEELAEMQSSSERAALSPSIPQAKRTEPLRGSFDEHAAATEAKLARAAERADQAEAVMKEMQEQMRGVMEANRALLTQARLNATDMPTAPTLPKLTKELERQANEGELDGPIQTREGWLVPRVTTANPEQTTTAALLTALKQSNAAGAAKSAKRAAADDKDE